MLITLLRGVDCGMAVKNEGLTKFIVTFFENRSFISNRSVISNSYVRRKRRNGYFHSSARLIIMGKE